MDVKSYIRKGPGVNDVVIFAAEDVVLVGVGVVVVVVVVASLS